MGRTPSSANLVPSLRDSIPCALASRHFHAGFSHSAALRLEYRDYHVNGCPSFDYAQNKPFAFLGERWEPRTIPSHVGTGALTRPAEPRSANFKSATDLRGFTRIILNDVDLRSVKIRGCLRIYEATGAAVLPAKPKILPTRSDTWAPLERQ